MNKKHRTGTINYKDQINKKPLHYGKILKNKLTKPYAILAPNRTK